MPRHSLRLSGAAVVSAVGLALLSTAAAEAPTGHYHPNDIAAASTVFAAAAESVGPRYEAAAGTLKKVGGGLELLELGALSMGDRAPAGLLDWMESARRQAAGERLQLQAHVNLMGEDYSTEFGAALERVLKTQGGGLVECGATGIAAMVGGKNCPGEDANARIAAAIDQDATLQAAIQSIGAIEWPGVSEPRKEWAVVPLTGSENWVQAGALVRALVPARLETHLDDFDRALSKVLEDDSRSEDERLAEAKAARARYTEALAADGAVLFEAMTVSLEKGAKKGAPARVGLCANAPVLGGCAGTDVTRDVVGFLRNDKKFQKAAAAL